MMMMSSSDKAGPKHQTTEGTKVSFQTFPNFAGSTLEIKRSPLPYQKDGNYQLELAVTGE
jgi:hypothetical protein